MTRKSWLICVAAIAIASYGCGPGADPPVEQPVGQVSQQPAPGATEPPARPEVEPSADGPSPQAGTAQKVRGPAVAGMFYKRHKDDLAKEVDGYLATANPEPVEKLRGLISPHAGYDYSGQTAAFAYKLLKGRDLDTVIVMAPSHTARFDGASIPEVIAYETPLGLVPLSPRATKLAGQAPFCKNPTCEVRRPAWWRQAPKELPAFGEDTPHSWEHSLEVQLPFLQRTLGTFHLVPIVFGQVDPEDAARVLAGYVDDKTLLVASSDLSHYHPYQTPKGLDTTCIEAILRLNTDWMERQEACGKGPILTLMHLALKRGWKAKLLDYRNSGDVTGDRSGVVGYAAIAFVQGSGVREPEETPLTGFTSDERKFLLDLARKALVDVVNARGLPEVDPKDVPKKLTTPGGCFVTLTKGGKLRGCVGHIFPQEPLYQAVLDNAQAAALQDFRFPSVKRDELDEIAIEVSVLTVPKPLEFKTPGELLRKLRPHVDGAVLRVGQRQATYLPQVWEQIPQTEAFLSHLAEKAGLDPAAWKDPEAGVLIYQVEAFHESER